MDFSNPYGEETKKLLKKNELSSRYHSKRNSVNPTIENEEIDRSSPFRHEHSGKIGKMSNKMRF